MEDGEGISSGHPRRPKARCPGSNPNSLKDAMINHIIKWTLISLLIFTPIAFGSMELWAFSLMELVIFSIIVLGTLRWAFRPPPETGDAGDPVFSKKWAMPALFLIFFLLFVFFQMVPLPSELLKILSPKTYALRKFLIFVDHQSTIRNPQFAISFVPFATQIEFFKWFSLIALFLFLLKWRPLEKGRGTLVSVIIFIGILETLYGIVEFSSGHRHILNLDASSIVSSVTGRVINRNFFPGSLLLAT